MVRLVAALVITTLVLGAAAVVALGIDPAAAAAAQVSEDSEDGDDESEVRKFAFIGVAISTVSPAEAEELDIAGAARVVEVRDGSPSAGVVQVGDIVTAVNGEAVASVAGLGEKVRAATIGEMLTLTVVRDGETLDLEVTPVEREVRVEKREFRVERHLPGLLGANDHMLDALSGLHGKIVKLDLVVETDDGFKIVRVLAGTATNIDPGNLSFTLTLADGSGSVDLQGTAETMVITARNGDFGGLNDIDRTLVVEMDGELKLVTQGEDALGRYMPGLQSITPHLKGMAPQIEKRPYRGPRIGKQFEWKDGPVPSQLFRDRKPDFERLLDGLHPEVRERLADLLHDDDDVGDSDEDSALPTQ